MKINRQYIPINPKLSTDLKRNRGLDLVRAIAITMVLAGHLRHLIAPNYNGGLLQGIPYFVTSFGHFGVILFFGLSGVLIQKRMKKISTSEDFLNFIYVRVYRIYSVLLPALFFSYLIDLIADSTGLYDGIENYSIISQESNPSTRLGPSTILINILSLQTFLGPYLGSNGSLWSLSYEVWFYIVGGLYYYKRYLIVAALPLVALQPIWGLYFLFWLSAPYFVRYGHQSLCAFIISTCLLSLFHYARPSYIDIIYVLYFFLNFKFVTGFPGNKLADYLAKISYTLYVFHYPILLFLVFFLFPQRIKSLSVLDTTLILALLFLCIECLYRMFEGNPLILRFYNKLRGV